MSRWPDKKIRFRRDTCCGQRWNRGDFILWHKRRHEKGDVWWDTDIGQGRPAWNIQDAAMIKKGVRRARMRLAGPRPGFSLLRTTRPSAFGPRPV
jgi:cysteinyl-tRNA synthetase